MATKDTVKFARLGHPGRIWAIGSVHAEAERLAVLHDTILERLRTRDRLVYLGNLIGRGPQVPETVAEALRFRRVALSLPGWVAGDIVFLRGQQEEMWQKLLQLQFAHNPSKVLDWMAAQGVEATLEAYGGRLADGRAAARDGAVQLTRWTNGLRERMRGFDGHTALFAALKRAAFTDPPGVLLVSAGLDMGQPLDAQGDQFWWGGGRFNDASEGYDGHGRLVRGFDPVGGGLCVGPVAATIDGNCGRGGTLLAGLFAADGEVLDVLEV
jgi:hypothetical protein